MSREHFYNIAAAKVMRSLFDLSFDNKLTCDFGELVPIMCEEAIPSDVWNIQQEIVVRMQPLLAPVLHRIDVTTHTFFVPYRILWPEWEKFITGGEDGEYGNTDLPGHESDEPMPRWIPSELSKCADGTLWDYLGFPTITANLPTGDMIPLDFPRRAYNMIWNEYYRDQNLMDPVDEDNEDLLYVCWEKDYFTSALPWQQRGVGPALPISGATSAVFLGDEVDSGEVMQESLDDYSPSLTNALRYRSNIPTLDGGIYHAGGSQEGFKDWLNQNEVDLSVASTFDIAQLRAAIQVQRWMELNARAGARYTEFLKAHFHAAPRDERLQRPEYIGGTKNPIIVSEVLQTGETSESSPQGNLAGHGIGVSKSFVGKYRVNEFGLIMTLMNIKPKSAYQQGIDRQWLRQTKYDFVFPEFVNLSEQGVLKAELYRLGGDNDQIFGYQGRYNECRSKRSQVHGMMRGKLDYWHLGRKFSSSPSLNEYFLLCNDSTNKRIFAVQDEDGFIVNVGNIVKCVRPLPVVPEPGFMDH